MEAPEPKRRRSIRKRPTTSLPDELLTEILLRLPAEIVHKFRNVCPRWRALTSTPQFAEMHYIQQTVPAILLQENAGCKVDKICSGMEISLVEKWEEEATRMSPRITNVRPKCIAAKSWHTYHACFSYHGLVLLKGTFPTQKKENGTFQSPLTDFVIYNPINQDTVRIFTRGQELGGEIYGMFLHPIIKEYCVLWGLFQGRRVQFKMLNLGSQPQWRDIQAGNSVTHRPKLPPVHMNDVLYWIIGACYKNHCPTCEEFIMAFDIKSEEFSVMPHPGPRGCSANLHRGMDLLKMGRFLSLVQYSCPDNSRSTTIIDIWTLTDVAERFWIKSHSINLELEFSGHGTIQAIAVVNGELLLQWAYKKFYACNLEQGNIRKFGRKYIGCGRALAHFTSLVSLKNCKSEIRMEEPVRRTRAPKVVK